MEIRARNKAVGRYVAQETKTRFGVELPIENFPAHISPKEEAAVKTVLQYMDIAYSPERNKGGSSVTQFCTQDSTFAAPSTFPAAHTPMEYADAHAKVMRALTNLHIIRFDIVVVKDNLVSLRYTATGAHIGDEHSGIPATHRSAEWTAAGNFIVDENQAKIKHWWKDWDKMRMWKQLGWVRPDNDAVEFA